MIQLCVKIIDSFCTVIKQESHRHRLQVKPLATDLSIYWQKTHLYSKHFSISFPYRSTSHLLTPSIAELLMDTWGTPLSAL